MIVCSRCGELAVLTTPQKPHPYKYDTFYECKNPACTNTSIINISLKSINPIDFEDASYERMGEIKEEFNKFWKVGL